MRLFVALGIVVVTFLLLAAKVTRHHHRVTPHPEAEEAGAEAPATPATRGASFSGRRVWSGPTLRDLLASAPASAAIRGHARAPEGVAISVRASLAGTRDRGRRVRVENGEFDIPGLLFGRSYDLVFGGPNLRQTTLRSVTAPADDVEAKLDPLPVLRGAIGFPAGGACQYDQVVLRSHDAEAEDVVEVGLENTCRFELAVPDGPTQMVVVATGDAPELEMPVVIPPVGDPEPVCLNPPCLADPLAGSAELRISFDGPGHTDLSATLTFAGGNRSRSYHCVASGEDCQLVALPINELFQVSAESADCASTKRTIVLHPGENLMSFPCAPPDSIQAEVNDPEGEPAQDEVVVE